MSKVITASIILAGLSLAACGPQVQPPPPQPPVQYQQPQVASPGSQPVIINQAPQSNGTEAALMGGALGYMLGRSTSGAGGGSSNSVTNNTIIKEKTIIKQGPTVYVPAPAPTPAPVVRVTPTPPPKVVVQQSPVPTTKYAPASSYKQSTPTVTVTRSGKR